MGFAIDTISSAAYGQSLRLSKNQLNSETMRLMGRLGVVLQNSGFSKTEFH